MGRSGDGAERQDYAQRTFFSFDAQCSIIVAHEGGRRGREAAEALLEDCVRLCRHYERLFSPTRDDSELVRLNTAGGVPVRLDAEMIDLLDVSRHYCEVSDGRLDITAGELARLWNFHRATVPSREEVEEALRHVGIEGLHVEGDRAWLDDPLASVTLGSTAKGYIADRLAERLRRDGVRSAVINLGGNVCLLGSRADGHPWEVALADPLGRGIASMLDLSDASVVTSGTTERCFVRDGVAYHHIVDLSTGMPARSDLASVTVVAGSSTEADGWSTTLLLAGSEEALRMVGRTEGVEALLVRADGSMVASAGLVRTGTRRAGDGVEVPTWSLGGSREIG